MTKCKACQIDFSKLKDKPEFKYPTNIPVSKEMRDVVDGLRKVKRDEAGRTKRR